MAPYLRVKGSAHAIYLFAFTIDVEPEPARIFSYDANGNMTSVVTTNPDSSVETVLYGWDALDRLVSITSGTLRTEFSYDGLGRRVVQREYDGETLLETRRFLWEDFSIVQERSGSTGGTLVKEFFDDGEVRHVGATQESYFYVHDHLGSLRAVMDDVAQVVARYDYSPYGEVEKVSGELDFDMLYTGHFYHERTGLHLAPFRAYDPRIGRWINRDPLGEAGGINLYAYVSGNPINATDPLGLVSSVNKHPQAFAWAMGGVGYVVGGVNSAKTAVDNGASFGEACLAGNAGGIVGGVTGFSCGYGMGLGVADFAEMQALGVPLRYSLPQAVGGLGVGGYGGYYAMGGSGRSGAFPANASASALRTPIAPTSRAARREAMRQFGIPTSQTPDETLRPRGGPPQYRYGNNVLTHYSPDASPPNPHWEAGVIMKNSTLGRLGIYRCYGDKGGSSEKVKIEYLLPEGAAGPR